MAYRLVTCPETAHLELLEFEEDPLGLLVQACSRFGSSRRIHCPRTCAARLDRLERGMSELPEDDEEVCEEPDVATEVEVVRSP